jgi:hypothetical protein
MVLCILEFVDCLVDEQLELLLPAIVQFVQTGVTLDAVLGHRADEVLAGFCVLLCLYPTAFRGVGTVFLRFF